ncbi:hypothetical protein JXM83_04710 [Candidatus Woesearchaeota archaeon]|nr:hypothetical protein [Candidatus Woesearchaeota archaeon]
MGRINKLTNPDNTTKQILYSQYNITDSDENLTIHNFEKTCKEYLCSNKDKISTEAFHFLKEKGLYFQEEFNKINGVLIVTNKGNIIFPNPFVSEHIISEDELKKIFE